MSQEPSTCLSPKRQRISESSVDTTQLPTLPLLPCNLPPTHLDIDSEESAAEDQNSSTSDEKRDSGAAAARPRAESKKSKAQGSKQGQSSHESTYRQRSSGGRTQIRGHNPRRTILHLWGLNVADCKSHRLVGYLPRIHVVWSHLGREGNNQSIQKPTEDSEKLGSVTDLSICGDGSIL